jgi:hypothetical protein
VGSRSGWLERGSLGRLEVSTFDDHGIKKREVSQ